MNCIIEKLGWVKIFVETLKRIKTTDETINQLAVILGKLENKAIIQLIDEVGLTKTLETYLSKRELNRYYRSKYKLKVLLNG